MYRVVVRDANGCIASSGLDGKSLHGKEMWFVVYWGGVMMWCQEVFFERKCPGVGKK